jgi:mannobiose 2-epimerase
MSINPEKIAEFGRRIEDEWRNDIAPFWLKYGPDEKHGGFRGWMSNDLRVDERADKGIILNARILWTFSRAYKLYQNVEYRAAAERAYAYLIEHFVDSERGGVFWTVTYQGHPSDTRKRPYAQAFAVYGLTEFYVATGDQTALKQALELFHLLETHCRDYGNDGYFETFERDWRLAADQRLSEVDQDDKKSMNTHLHILEAYASLHRATGDAQVKHRLRNVIHLFFAYIINPKSFHLNMFFDEEWRSTSAVRSFGHDIEASWLLCEAAEALGEKETLATARASGLALAQSVYERGLDADGSLFYEGGAVGIRNDEKHWWAQTEAVVGFLNAHALSGADYFLIGAMRAWEFIDDHLIDKQNGEWFWKTSRAGAPSLDLPKLSQWKCPYHNGRMCFEISRRLSGGKENPETGPQGV